MIFVRIPEGLSPEQLQIVRQITDPNAPYKHWRQRPTEHLEAVLSLRLQPPLEPSARLMIIQEIARRRSPGGR